MPDVPVRSIFLQRLLELNLNYRYSSMLLLFFSLFPPHLFPRSCPWWRVGLPPRCCFCFSVAVAVAVVVLILCLLLQFLLLQLLLVLLVIADSFNPSFSLQVPSTDPLSFRQVLVVAANVKPLNGFFIQSVMSTIIHQDGHYPHACQGMSD